LVLLQAGFTLPRTVASRAVRSYRTISPLPAAQNANRRYLFCGTFHGLAPSRRYLAPCPKEPGLSSGSSSFRRLSGRLRLFPIDHYSWSGPGRPRPPPCRRPPWERRLRREWLGST